MEGRAIALAMVLAQIAAPVATSRALAPSSHYQQQTLLVRVVDSLSQRPLPNAEVIELDTRVQQFTDARGDARVRWPATGIVRLRVRQIGYRYEDRTIDRAAPARDEIATAAFALLRVAYTLPIEVTLARSRCDTEQDQQSKLLSATVLEQLRAGAERYEAFRKAYPFRVQVERATASVGAGGAPGTSRREIETVDSEQWGDRYLAGKVIERRPLGFSVPILFLANLADPRFWEQHCFMARGMESIGGDRVVRMDFSRAAGLKTADWEGSAFVDSTSSLLRRVEFRLAGMKDDERPQRLEGYTVFASPSPFIVVPDTTVAVWWRRLAVDTADWGPADVVQVLSVRSIAYRKKLPPAQERP